MFHLVEALLFDVGIADVQRRTLLRIGNLVPLGEIKRVLWTTPNRRREDRGHQTCQDGMLPSHGYCVPSEDCVMFAVLGFAPPHRAAHVDTRDQPRIEHAVDLRYGSPANHQRTPEGIRRWVA
jgi:hypothetical protein